MTNYWFRPKRYGYGATPVTWQGWTVTIGFALAIAAVSLVLRLTDKNRWAVAALLAFDAVVLGALVIICRRKTDGEWRWRWGGQ